MSNELLNETLSAFFAHHVDKILGAYTSVTDREYNALTDECTVWTSACSHDINQSMDSLRDRLRMRTAVDSVSIYASKKNGFRIVLSGCLEPYKRWSRTQLRIRNLEAIHYFVLGALIVLAVFVFLFV